MELAEFWAFDCGILCTSGTFFVPASSFQNIRSGASNPGEGEIHYTGLDRAGGFRYAIAPSHGHGRMILLQGRQTRREAAQNGKTDYSIGQTTGRTIR